jgi:predicted tellurium resistance membrane protein TerC
VRTTQLIDGAMFEFDIFLSLEGWISLLTLTAMEIVLGIDNIVFISIMTGKLPLESQARARSIGLVLALFMRLGLLFALSWLMRLTDPIFTVLDRGVSGRDLILISGGLFLVGKAVHEIHDKLEVRHESQNAPMRVVSMTGIIIQVILLDIVFSLDSVITAIGMAPALIIMVIAMVIAVGVMLVFSGVLGRIVERHPTIKILALSFLLLIGVMLVAEGIGQHISKGMIYFTMAFALAVELVNLRVRKNQAAPVELHNRLEKR